MLVHAQYMLASAAAMLLAAGAWASDAPSSPAPPARPGQLHWPVPTSPVLIPQTDAQKSVAQQNGRIEPKPEILQPKIDPALIPYQPTAGLIIKRRYNVGSSDVLPGLVQAWTREFQKHHPDFSLTIDRPMAGSLGTLELIKGNLDFVFVSRELKPSDISGFTEKFGYPPFSVPISGGAWRHFGFLDSMGFMVHPDNPVRQLSFLQLDAMFSATRHRGGRPVRTWGDLGLKGKWAKQKVTTYGIKPWNGFEEFIRQRVLSISGKRGEWHKDVHFDPTFFAVARRVAADKGAIGYTGLSAIDSEVKIVPVSVDAAGPYLTPTYENVASAAYPLARVIYLNANSKPRIGLDPALREFMKFILSRDGQNVVREHAIYLPLRAFQVRESVDYASAH